MRFWNILGWIIGVPLAFIFGGAVLYCIFYAIGKVFGGIWDFIKYPQYYWDEFKKFVKKYKDIIFFVIILYILVVIVLWLLD